MPIHPTAIVDPNAKLGDGVEVGPFVTIGPNAEIGAGSVISAYAMVNWTLIGKNSKVGAKSIIGGDPQIYEWQKCPSWVKIGDGVTINELTAIHRSMYEGKSTTIGDGCYIMTQVHVGHDCQLGKEVTLTTFSGLSGHVEIDDYAVIGGATGIHQFVRIGSMSMVGGMSKVIKYVLPFFTVTGNPCMPHGLNTLALKKRGVSIQERKEIKEAYKIIVREGLTSKAALEKLTAKGLTSPAASKIISFMKSSRRGLAV